MNKRQIKKYNNKIREELLVCRKLGYGMSITYEGDVKFDENGIPQHMGMRKVPLVKRYQGNDLDTTVLGTTGNGKRMENIKRMVEHTVYKESVK